MPINKKEAANVHGDVHFGEINAPVTFISQNGQSNHADFSSPSTHESSGTISNRKFVLITISIAGGIVICVLCIIFPEFIEPIREICSYTADIVKAIACA